MLRTGREPACQGCGPNGQTLFSRGSLEVFPCIRGGHCQVVVTTSGAGDSVSFWSQCFTEDPCAWEILGWNRKRCHFEKSFLALKPCDCESRTERAGHSLGRGKRAAKGRNRWQNGRGRHSDRESTRTKAFQFLRRRRKNSYQARMQQQ